MAQQISFDRTQIEAIVKDPQSVVQFENLITALNSVTNTTETINNAVTTVNSVSAQVEQILSLLDNAPNPVSMEDVSELVSRVQSLEMAPPPMQLVQPRYGMFYDTTTQSAALANTAYAVTFDSTMTSLGISVASSSQLTVDRHGRYIVQWSVHPNNSGGSLKNTWSWLRKNGVDVSYTLVHSTIVSGGAESQAGGRHLVELAAGEYVEIYWATDDTGITLAPDAASAFYPAGPSATVSLTDNFAHKGIMA